ncbi:MAG: UDP-N-acetylmuramate dehydrogenase [Spirochaetales bacterium]|nr:UDP-N-acetylmuramate dehydrogenase [Spirochaetales bacterium]
MATLRKFLENCNIDAEIRYDEPMSAHTSFRIGGPADAFVRPSSVQALATLLQAAAIAELPLAVIGGGANLLVADAGVRGIVACTDSIAEVRVDTDGSMHAGAGLPVRNLVQMALERGRGGLEFAAGLPGSVGGAVYMNARCYDREFADVIARVEYLKPSAGAWELSSSAIDRAAWSYKRSPFMPAGALTGAVVVGASFKLVPGDRAAIAAEMAGHEADRIAKGHYDYPSAGSLFKNNRGFGRPTGSILDELGFRGRRIGDAMVSPKHANIFVNAGAATAADMRKLIDEARSAAKKAFGVELETEVEFLGAF